MDRFEANLRQLAATHNFLFVGLPDGLGRSAEPVIRSLVAALVAGGAIRPEVEPAAVQAVLARERVASTGIGQGVALPHATIPAGDRVVGALAHSEAGLTWESIDGRPVHWVCLVMAPRDRPGDYLRVLQAVSQTLKQVGGGAPA